MRSAPLSAVPTSAPSTCFASSQASAGVSPLPTSTGLAAVVAAIKLLGDELAVPVQQGVWSGDGGDVCEALAPEWVGERRQPAAFGVAQAQPAAPQVGFEDAVFRLQIGDDLLLLALEPAGKHSQEQWKNHSLSSGWR